MTEVYDAIVVGSGAAGGWAAKELTERGLDTLLLEAGRTLDPEADFPQPSGAGASKVQVLTRAKAVLGGQHVQARCMSYSPLTQHLFLNDRENPYVVPKGAPFNWYRGRQVGGRLHLWGRNALRISDHELKAASRDGFGHDWPVGYDDLAPWYEKVERFLGVAGDACGIPSIPDGVYTGPHTTTKAEDGVLESLARAWPDRPATTCRIIRHNPGRIPLPIVAAQATGKLTLISDAVVSHVTVDEASGQATGVAYAERESGRRHEARGRNVMLCASTIESVRVLLNSRSDRHPNGIGNSSGNLGRNLTDHVMVLKAGPHEPLEPIDREAYDFGAQSGLYVPNFRNVDGDDGLGFLRGYSMLGSVGRIPPGWFFMAIGEMLPRPENRIELDPKKRDRWGIPAARITCVHSDNERAMIKDMNETLTALADACGLTVDLIGQENFLARVIHRVASRLVYTKDGALIPGSSIHETGGAPMGTDPARHVLDAHGRCFDAPNVYVTDAASFPTAPFQNPGLTIMALSARAANHVADGSA